MSETVLNFPIKILYWHKIDITKCVLTYYGSIDTILLEYMTNSSHYRQFYPWFLEVPSTRAQLTRPLSRVLCRAGKSRTYSDIPDVMRASQGLRNSPQSGRGRKMQLFTFMMQVYNMVFSNKAGLNTTIMDTYEELYCYEPQFKTQVKTSLRPDKLNSRHFLLSIHYDSYAIIIRFWASNWLKIKHI